MLYMLRKKRKLINIFICNEVLEAIFDECDRNNINETGGRILGFLENRDNEFRLKVCGFIGPGPNASSSPTSFFQDGIYQEKVFRSFERKDPAIEHLGNWHSHHVNGLKTLSGGDIETYKKIVNHNQHNIDLFYAMLVVAKHFEQNKRYTLKHYIFVRGDSKVYELPDSAIHIANDPAIFIDRCERDESENTYQLNLNKIRALDKELISKIYPGIRPYISGKTGSVYWRGKINLIDNSLAEIIVLESLDADRPQYKITLSEASANIYESKQIHQDCDFESAWRAIVMFERSLNRELFNMKK
jgi:hypothetical protein